MALDIYLIDGTYQWQSPRTIQKSNKERLESLKPSDRKALRKLGYSNRGRAGIKRSHDLLNKHHPVQRADTRKCKVQITMEDSSTQWVEVSKGIFYYWDHKGFGGDYSRPYAEEIAGLLRKANPQLKIEVIPVG